MNFITRQWEIRRSQQIDIEHLTDDKKKPFSKRFLENSENDYRFARFILGQSKLASLFSTEQHAHLIATHCHRTHFMTSTILKHIIADETLFKRFTDQYTAPKIKKSFLDSFFSFIGWKSKKTKINNPIDYLAFQIEKQGLTKDSHFMSNLPNSDLAKSLLDKLLNNPDYYQTLSELLIYIIQNPSDKKTMDIVLNLLTKNNFLESINVKRIVGLIRKENARRIPSEIISKLAQINHKNSDRILRAYADSLLESQNNGHESIHNTTINKDNYNNIILTLLSSKRLANDLLKEPHYLFKLLSELDSTTLPEVNKQLVDHTHTSIEDIISTDLTYFETIVSSNQTQFFKHLNFEKIKHHLKKHKQRFVRLLKQVQTPDSRLLPISMRMEIAYKQGKRFSKTHIVHLVSDSSPFLNGTENEMTIAKSFFSQFNHHELCQIILNNRSNRLFLSSLSRYLPPDRHHTILNSNTVRPALVAQRTAEYFFSSAQVIDFLSKHNKLIDYWEYAIDLACRNQQAAMQFIQSNEIQNFLIDNFLKEKLKGTQTLSKIIKTFKEIDSIFQVLNKNNSKDELNLSQDSQAPFENSISCKPSSSPILNRSRKTQDISKLWQSIQKNICSYIEQNLYSLMRNHVEFQKELIALQYLQSAKKPLDPDKSFHIRHLIESFKTAVKKIALNHLIKDLEKHTCLNDSLILDNLNKQLSSSNDLLIKASNCPITEKMREAGNMEYLSKTLTPILTLLLNSTAFLKATDLPFIEALISASSENSTVLNKIYQQTLRNSDKFSENTSFQSTENQSSSTEHIAETKSKKPKITKYSLFKSLEKSLKNGTKPPSDSRKIKHPDSLFTCPKCLQKKLDSSQSLSNSRETNQPPQYKII